jgi:hypothetical protein
MKLLALEHNPDQLRTLLARIYKGFQLLSLEVVQIETFHYHGNFCFLRYNCFSINYLLTL